MDSTKAQKAGGWLANYYLRGAIALAVALGAVAVGIGHGIPLLIGAVVWLGLWAVARARS